MTTNYLIYLRRYMRYILCLATLFVALNSTAQNDLKARIEYEEAEKAFAEEKYDDCVTRLIKAEELLEKWTPKTGYLKIVSLDKLCDYNDVNNAYTSLQVKEVKRYTSYAKKNQAEVDIDKFTTVYKIEEKINYLLKLQADENMPEYKNGLEAYNKKDYDKAMTYWITAAEKDNWKAMDHISDMYRDGVGVNQDYSKSIEWDTKAANKGYYVSMVDIGSLHLEGKGVKQDLAYAYKLFQKAADNGNSNAMLGIGNMYSFGLGVDQNYREALNWYKKAAESGNESAMYVIGATSNFDIWMKVDEEYYQRTRKSWIEKAAKKGHTEAMINWGQYLRAENNQKEALEWYIKAADLGNTNGLYELGIYYTYDEHINVRKDITQGVKWFTMAADAGNLKAMETLKMIYEIGYGNIKKDKRAASDWQSKYEAAKAKQ